MLSCTAGDCESLADYQCCYEDQVVYLCSQHQIQALEHSSIHQLTRVNHALTQNEVQTVQQAIHWLQVATHSAIQEDLAQMNTERSMLLQKLQSLHANHAATVHSLMEEANQRSNELNNMLQTGWTLPRQLRGSLLRFYQWVSDSFTSVALKGKFDEICTELQCARLRNSADQLLSNGCPEKAIAALEECIEVQARTGLRRDRLDTLIQLADLLEEPLDLWREIVELQREFGLVQELSLSLEKCASLLFKKGCFLEASILLMESVDICRNLQETIQLGLVLKQLGLLYNYAGMPRDAIKAYKEAIVLFKCQNMKIELAAALEGLGNVFFSTKSIKTIDTYLDAVVLLIELGDKPRLGRAFYNLGLTYLDRSMPTEAIDVLQMSASLRKQLGMTLEFAVVQRSLGKAYQVINNFEEALECFHCAVKASKRIKLKQLLVQILNDTADVFSDMDMHDSAIAAHQKALAIVRKFGSRKDLGKALDYLGTDYLCAGYFGLAVHYLRPSIEIFEELQDKKQLAYTFQTLGITFWNCNLLKPASLFIEKSNLLAEELQLLTVLASNKKLMGVIAESQGNIGKAVGLFRESDALYQEDEFSRAWAALLNSCV